MQCVHLRPQTPEYVVPSGCLVVLSDTDTLANKDCLFSHLEHLEWVSLLLRVLHKPFCSKITVQT